MNKLTKQINKQLADMSSINELFSDADDAFVERIMTNSESTCYNRSYLRNLICHI